MEIQILQFQKSDINSENEINDGDEKINLETLTKKIAEGFKAALRDKDVVVIMSNIKVNKVRSGFILRNQQVKKSFPKGTNTAECDGTVIVILDDIIKRVHKFLIMKNIQFIYH